MKHYISVEIYYYLFVIIIIIFVHIVLVFYGHKWMVMVFSNEVV